MEATTVRWAFWRSRSPEPRRALPDDVGLPVPPRPAPAPRDREDGDDIAPSSRPSPRTSGATPTAHPDPTYDLPPAAPTAGIDRAALVAAGSAVAASVHRLRSDTPTDDRATDDRATDDRTTDDRATDDRATDDRATDDRTVAVAATGALAARLPALSGLDGAAVFGEPEDELLHAYADVLVRRAAARRTAVPVDRDDLLAVAHLAAAAAAVHAAGDPALLLLAGVPPDQQLRAAALLLAQTADDGAGPPDRLAAEVREVFRPQR